MLAACHMARLGKLYAEARRIVRPGGYLVLHAVTNGSQQSIWITGVSGSASELKPGKTLKLKWSVLWTRPAPGPACVRSHARPTALSG